MSKNQFTGTATQPQRNRKYFQFSYDQYCITIKGHNRNDLEQVSDVNVPCLVLLKRRHGVLGLTCRRTIEEGSVVTNCKRAGNQTCSTLQ